MNISKIMIGMVFAVSGVSAFAADDAQTDGKSALNVQRNLTDVRAGYRFEKGDGKSQGLLLEGGHHQIKIDERLLSEYRLQLGVSQNAHELNANMMGLQPYGYGTFSQGAPEVGFQPYGGAVYGYGYGFNPAALPQSQTQIKVQGEATKAFVPLSDKACSPYIGANALGEAGATLEGAYQQITGRVALSSEGGLVCEISAINAHLKLGGLAGIRLGRAGDIHDLAPELGGKLSASYKDDIFLDANLRAGGEARRANASAKVSVLKIKGISLLAGVEYRNTYSTDAKLNEQLKDYSEAVGLPAAMDVTRDIHEVNVTAGVGF